MKSERESAVILLSAGLDSTANLVLASEELRIVLALTFDYGQRAAPSEIAHARALATQYSIPHRVVELPFFKEFTQTSLVNNAEEVPVGHEVQMDDLAQSQSTKTKVWVPNRNGIMLNIAAGFAEGLKANYVIPGYNKEEAATFPDNSESFLKATDQTLYFSTSTQVQTKCYTSHLDKTEIVKELQLRKFDFSLTWPCYFSGTKICGTCESCQRYRRALKANGVET